MSELSDKETEKTVPFTIAFRKKKIHFGINLTKEVKDHVERTRRLW